MRTRFIRSFPVVAAALAVAVAGGRASAQQIDTNPPLPNVLLLLDNSGSMERMVDGNTPEQDGNSCNCVDNGPGHAPTCTAWSQNPAPAPPAPNRWGAVQTSLTGSLTNGYNCVAMQRTPGSTFASEYEIDYQPPYDLNYYMPFHRLVAEDTSSATPVACVVAPGGLPGAPSGEGVGPSAVGLGGLATAFPAGAIVAREYGLFPPASVACTSQTSGAVVGFPQNPDGALTSMNSLMRFGLMTFDSDTSGATGVNAGSTVSFPIFPGMWSYFPGWNSGGACPYNGYPANCTSGPTLMGVGARNPGAPPWEGRLVGFPSSPSLTAQQQNNNNVASVILATRPYGATPMAGMFADAQYYLWNDSTGPQQTDSYVQGMCRSEYIILLTDGAPNLDLQPTCSATGSPSGKCPFALPYSSTGTAAQLYANGQSTSTQASVATYVIGYAVSSYVDGTTPVNCSQFAQNGGSYQATCNCNDPNLPAYTVASPDGGPLASGNIGPCCVLQCIAKNGGTGNAYFASTPGSLQQALASILADIAKNTTTRTTPAYSPTITNVLASQTGTTQPNSSVYLASFNPSPGQPWSGDIQRQRYVCTYSGSGYTVPTPTVQVAQGDDFADNLNSGSGTPRQFIAYQPAAQANGTVDSTTTIRPYAPLVGGDGIGQLKATMFTGPASAVVPQITYQAMGIPSNGCAYTSTLNGATKYLTAPTCAQMLLDFTFAQPTFTGIPSDFSFTSRAQDALGSIYHANPVVVGPPGSLLQDPGYIGFASSASGWGGRQNVVYAVTNDGLLHAFWADVTTLTNNELWAMLPPGVMNNINGGSYPSNQSFLLDGSPVVKDVVWDRSTANASDPTVWHTMLVAGFGPQAQGYYAVDVTNPSPTGMTTGANPAPDPPPTGPVFRWQLTKLPANNMPLFGSQSATPAITTLYMDPGDGNGAREIGVAILPGGEDVVPSTQAECQRYPKTSDSAPINQYTARTNVRCWSNPTPPATQKYTDFVLGRSVSIVRLDTGQILRVFARQTDYQLYPSDTLNTLGWYVNTPLDSPMVGTPVVYPNDVGTDATKFFITDADGTVWRFDVSSSNPANWFGELYLDLYNQTVDTSSTAWSDGEPVQVPPVLSLDPSGNVVLNVASGLINQFDTTGIEYVYSITEKVAQSVPPKLRANVNWWLQPAQIDNLAGERVSGPMTVFNGTLYFATYAVPPAGVTSCNSGTARLWGRDFVTPMDPTCATNPTGCNRSLGGLPELQPPSGPQNPAPTWIEPDLTNPALAGKVIPGVTIMGTPACANLGTPGTDSYVYGATHSAPQDYAGGSYSLFSQVGAKSSTGAGAATFSMAVPTPVSPTLIDSWAAVLE